MHQHVMSLKRLHPVDKNQYIKAKETYTEMFDKVFYDRYTLECVKLRQYLYNSDDMYLHIVKEICSSSFDMCRFTIRVSQDATTSKICLCVSDVLTYAHLCKVDVGKVYDIIQKGSVLTSIGFEQCVYLKDLSPLVEALSL